MMQCLVRSRSGPSPTQDSTAADGAAAPPPQVQGGDWDPAAPMAQTTNEKVRCELLKATIPRQHSWTQQCKVLYVSASFQM
jgi:hypothetical protein